MAIFAIVGTGGHGREAMALAQSMLRNGSLDDELIFVDLETCASGINGIRVVTTGQLLALDGKKFFNPAISSSSIRRKVVDEMTAAGLEPFSVVADNHCNLGHNRIGKGAIFSPFTTVTVNVTIGDYFHANNYAGVSHDCVIGDYVTFGPGVRCNGAVTVEDNVFVGAGTVIRQSTPNERIVIGSGSTIGMGAVVTKSVPAHSLVFGNPARLR